MPVHGDFVTSTGARVDTCWSAVELVADQLQIDPGRVQAALDAHGWTLTKARLGTAAAITWELPEKG